MSRLLDDLSIERLGYTAVCLLIAFSAFNLQRYRHMHAKPCLWWTYTLLVIGVGWELIDCWRYGPPGFPSSRWVVMPALAVILSWAAIHDLFYQRLARLIDQDRPDAPPAGRGDRQEVTLPRDG